MIFYSCEKAQPVGYRENIVVLIVCNKGDLFYSTGLASGSAGF